MVMKNIPAKTLCSTGNISNENAVNNSSVMMVIPNFLSDIDRRM